MDKIHAFESFLAAVRTGSLSGAARLRNLSQPAVSQQIAALEAQFDTRLLKRSRNGVHVTPAGALMVRHAQAILDEHARLIGALETLSGRVAGHLSVTASPGLSQHVLGDAIVDLARKYPEVEVTLRADVRILNLVEEGIDIALRSGTIGRGSGVARRIATMSMLLVATPTYLDAAGRPKAPDDLMTLDYIQFKTHDGQMATPLRRGDVNIQAPIKTGFTAQHPDLIIKALNGNLGFAKMPEFLVADDLRRGRLEVVLPMWELPGTELFVVFADRERRAPRFTAFLTLLLDQLEQTPGIDVPASTRQLRG